MPPTLKANQASAPTIKIEVQNGRKWVSGELEKVRGGVITMIGKGRTANVENGPIAKICHSRAREGIELEIKRQRHRHRTRVLPPLGGGVACCARDGGDG